MERKRMLDPNPSRRLTSRELASVLGVYLGVLVSRGAPPENLSRACGRVAEILRVIGAEPRMARAAECLSAEPELAGLVWALFGVSVGWEALGKPAAMSTALRFYAEQGPEVWAAVVAATEEAREHLRSVAERLEQQKQ